MVCVEYKRHVISVVKTGKPIAMSGYLEVKYPFKSNLGLNPFKSWKRQWCILRPSPTFSGGILAVYCSEAGAAAGTIDLPSGFVVRRAKSRTRPHAFAVFPADEPRKPRVLLAANTLHDAHIWMEKMRSLLSGIKLMDTDSLLNDSYSVAVNMTELSRKCGMSGVDSTVTVSSSGVLVSCSRKLGVFVEWKHVASVVLSVGNDRSGTSILTVDSEFHKGAGEFQFCSPLAAELTAALKHGVFSHSTVAVRKLSKSEGDLRTAKCSDIDLGDVRRTSWYSGPSEVSLDDLELVMSKECKRIPIGQLSRCIGAGDLAPAPTIDDSMSDRRSLASVASGIYEEIPDVPAPAQPDDSIYCKMSRDNSIMKCAQLGPEPQYECVADCLRGPARRPPPLPPRTLERGRSAHVARHGSLGALPGPAPAQPAARTLPRWDRSRQAFSAFRKRLKSDSRTAVSPKSETSKGGETKKKKFDFTPTRDIFRSLKVGRKMKNLKITSGLGNESKSCEFLDETEHVTPNRCSKSVECLEGNSEFLDGFDADLSIEFDDTIAALSLPQEIVQLILSNHDKILNEKMSININEGDYMPMSPIVPTPTTLEHHYIVMSPRSNIA